MAKQKMESGVLLARALRVARRLRLGISSYPVQDGKRLGRLVFLLDRAMKRGLPDRYR